jgi:tetratricopeptide (TPR) repeat protein
MSLLALLSWRQSRYDAGQAYAEQALDKAQSQSEGLKAYSLEVLGLIHYRLGDYVAARTYFEQAIAFYYTVGDRRGEIRSFYNIGCLYLYLQEIEIARDYFEQSLDTAQEIGDRVLAAGSLGQLGLVYCKLGDYTSARGYLGQSLGIHQEIGNQLGEAETFSQFGYVYYCMGNYKTAQRYCNLALDIQVVIEDGLGRGHSLTCLGHVLADQGYLDEAVEAYEEAVYLYRQMGRVLPPVDALAGLGRVRLMQNDFSRVLVYVEQLLPWLENYGTVGLIDPFWVYLAVYQALAVQPVTMIRAQTLLTIAYKALQDKASRLSNNAIRRNFLTNIKIHRELLALWEARSAATSTTRMG